MQSRIDEHPDFKDKIDADEAEKIKEQIKELKELMAKGPETVSPEEIKEKQDSVQQASLNLFQKVYQSKDAGSSEPAKDEPVDADFKEAKKEGKQ